MGHVLFLERKGTTLSSVMAGLLRHHIEAIGGQFFVHRYLNGTPKAFFDGPERCQRLAIQGIGQFRTDQQGQAHRWVGIVFVDVPDHVLRRSDR